MNLFERKLLRIFGFICLIFLFFTLITIISINKITKSSQKIQYVHEPSIQANLKLISAIRASEDGLNKWLLKGEENYLRQIDAAWSAIEKSYKRLLGLSDQWGNEDHVDLLKSLDDLLSQLKKNQQFILKKLMLNQNASSSILEEISLKEDILAKFRLIAEPQRWKMKREFDTVEKEQLLLKKIAILFFIIAVLICFFVLVYLKKSVINPMNTTIEVANSIAEGEYKSKDKLLSKGDSLSIAIKKMTDRLLHQLKQNEAQKNKLEKYSEELEELTYITTHDLKSPIITIQSFLKFLKEDKDISNKDSLQSIGFIDKAAGKASTKISDLIKVAKARHEVKQEVECLNLLSLFNEAKENLQSLIDSTNAQINIDFDNHPEIKFPKIQAVSIFQNLISNSLKYQPENQVPIIDLNTSKIDHYICLCVKDNGLGIDLQRHGTKIFGLFKRLHRKIPGSGIGLYTLKQSLARMDGKVEVESKENYGTTFKVFFNNNLNLN